MSYKKTSASPSVEKYPKPRAFSDDRSYSEKYAEGRTDEDLFQNKNVDWVSMKYTKVGYILLVLFIWMCLHSSRLFSVADCWTAVNVIHGVVNHNI